MKIQITTTQARDEIQLELEMRRKVWKPYQIDIRKKIVNFHKKDHQKRYDLMRRIGEIFHVMTEKEILNLQR